ncbi:hypothetical protein DH86_00001525 [Scytalidium sp. 3C]|nr:hypothetical protein DH86_00001525 [Scytalidium sp. 3C]
MNIISSPIRTMSSATAPKFEWLVILPDQKDALQRRLDVRPEHFKGLSANKGQVWTMGGAILDEVPKDDKLSFKGSCVVAVGASKEEVIEKLKEDVYAKNNVWDFDNIQIYPFKCAFRTEL